MKKDVKNIRVETGGLQINEDWPGVFIRGDNAAYYYMLLDTLLKLETNDLSPFNIIALEGLRDLLGSSNVETQKITSPDVRKS